MRIFEYEWKYLQISLGHELRVKQHKVQKQQQFEQYKSNKSGKSGVTWNKKGSRWEARISKDSVEYYLGSYSDMFDAIRARELAELDLYGAIKNKFTFPEDISN